jgi:hypothetical protein
MSRLTELFAKKILFGSYANTADGSQRQTCYVQQEPFAFLQNTQRPFQVLANVVCLQQSIVRIFVKVDGESGSLIVLASSSRNAATNPSASIIVCGDS